MNFLEIADLRYDLFLAWRRDAYIYYLSKSESGKEYLENAHRMEQTGIDRKALRKQFGRKEGEDDSNGHKD